MRRALFSVICGVLLAPPAAADAMRCGPRLVNTGALVAEVVGACGEPHYRDPWWTPHPAGRHDVADTEEWTYNFGPNQLLRVLRFRHGRLVDIRTDGYGFDPEHPGPCDPNALAAGLNEYRLLQRCGEPATRESYAVLRPLRSRHGVRDGRLEEVFRERWVYNFGSSQSLRVLTLENGRVTDVRSEGRGFDER